jgi:Cys-tRNA(Pro)/Cys-tRNA(Cys) deacylase
MVCEFTRGISILHTPMIRSGMHAGWHNDLQLQQNHALVAGGGLPRYNHEALAEAEQSGLLYPGRVETSTPALVDSRLDDVAIRVVRHGRVSSLEEAAELRGIPASKIVKTMVVRRSKDRYVFVLVPGNRVIDWAKLRDFLGVKRISMADAEDAHRRTGYVRGTITPFGSTTPWPVIADKRLSKGKISIGGGAPGVSITMKAPDLLEALEARVADVTRPGAD